jgi:hypothetical protein
MMVARMRAHGRQAQSQSPRRFSIAFEIFTHHVVRDHRQRHRLGHVARTYASPKPDMQPTITIVPDSEAEHGARADCGAITRSVWGYVSRNDDARAVYYARWTDGHHTHCVER